MENILKNEGLIDVREQIFRHFDLKTLKICQEVFAKRYGEEWDLWLEKLIFIQRLLEFGNKNTKEYNQYQRCYEKYNVKNKNFIPGWDKAVKKFGKMASRNDLNEIEESLKGLLEDRFPELYTPLHCAAINGYVKLMELLFLTDLNVNNVDVVTLYRYGRTAFIEACQEGQLEVVNLMVTTSKENGIDLNASDDKGCTGFWFACFEGHEEVVNLMLTSSIEYDIDLNARNHYGCTGLIVACDKGHTEIAKLMIENRTYNRTKYGINIQQKTNNGRTALYVVNEEIKYTYGKSKEKKESFKELLKILEEAISTDNESEVCFKFQNTNFFQH